MPGSHEGAPRSNPTEAPEEIVAEQQPTPEEIAELEADQENRKVDVEILGKSFRVRRGIDQGVTQAISGAHDRIAKFKNALSTPKNLYLENKYLSSKDKYDRVAAKAANSRFKITKRFYTNVANKRQQKMSNRQEKFNAHTNKMQGRLDHAKNRRDHHEDIHNNKLKMYIDRKVLAQSRKEVRKMRSEMRNDGKGRVEVARIIGNMTQEQRKRIGEVSLRLEIANRNRDKVSQEKGREQYQRTSNNDRITADRASLAEKLTSRQVAAENASLSTIEHVKVTDRIASLEQKLATGFDHDDADPDDPEDQGTALTNETRDRLILELDQTRAQADQLQKKINDSTDFIARTNSDIRSLEGGISSREQKVATAEGRIVELDGKIAEHNEKVRALEEERRRIIHQETGIELETSTSTEQDQTPTPSPAPLPTPQVTQTSTNTGNSNVIDLQAWQDQRNPQQPANPNNEQNNAA